MMEPLKPPVDGQVLRISRWTDVFETSHSRKYKVLTWISCPINFNSTGYQNLLDSFDPMEAAAMYGGWIALCQLAAQTKSQHLRGRLCGQKGELWNTRRIARLTGLPVEVYETLIPWALKIGWVEWAHPHEPYDETEQPAESSAQQLLPLPDDDSSSLPSQGSGTSLARKLPNLTQTQPNPTPPNEGCGEWENVQEQLTEAGVMASGKAVKTAKASGWTVAHARLVLTEFTSRPTAWSPATLFRRFEKPASVAPSDGWPDVSKEYRDAEKRRALEAREQREAAERLARSAETRMARERDGPVTFASEIDRLRKQALGRAETN